jgi:hypothetical protein
MNVVEKFTPNRQDPQHLDDIIIPDIEIDKGWPVSDVKTIEDCDDAYAFLMAAIASIEFDIELDANKIIDKGPLWAARARCALKYKRAALNIVNTKRGRIAEDLKAQKQAFRDKLLIAHIKRNLPRDQWMALIQSSGIDEAHLGVTTPEPTVEVE